MWCTIHHFYVNLNIWGICDRVNLNTWGICDRITVVYLLIPTFHVSDFIGTWNSYWSFIETKKLEKQDWSKTNLTVMLRYGIQYFKVGFFWMKLYSNCNFDFLACLSWLLWGLLQILRTVILFFSWQGSFDRWWLLKLSKVSPNVVNVIPGSFLL